MYHLFLYRNDDAQMDYIRMRLNHQPFILLRFSGCFSLRSHLGSPERLKISWKSFPSSASQTLRTGSPLHTCQGQHMLASYTAGPYSQSALLVCGRKVIRFLFNAHQYPNILWLSFPVLYYGHSGIYSVHVTMLFCCYRCPKPRLS